MTYQRRTPEVSAAPSSRRLPDLEGYRGLAAIAVLLYHCYQFCRGGPTFDYAYKGTPIGYLFLSFDSLVDLFLVLSAFVLFSPMTRRIVDGRATEPPRSFLAKRAVRILPLYWMAILIVWCTRNPALPGNWLDLLEHLTFTQVYDTKRIFWTIGPAWSLAVEVHFYVLLALLLAGFSRYRLHLAPRSTRLLVLCTVPAVLFVVSLSWNLFALVDGAEFTDWAVWYNPLAKGHMFATGMVLSILHALSRDRLPLGRPVVWALRWIGIGGVVAMAGSDHESALGSFVHHQVATPAYALLLASSIFAPNDSLWRRGLAHPVLMWLGAISYSVYLWHEPVLIWLDKHHLVSNQESALLGVILTLLATAVPVAAASHYILERPFGRLRAMFAADGKLADYYADAAVNPPARRQPAEAPALVGVGAGEQPDTVEPEATDRPAAPAAASVPRTGERVTRRPTAPRPHTRSGDAEQRRPGRRRP